MSERVKVWVKKKLQLGRLDLAQRDMYQVGQDAIFAMCDRLRQGRGPTDAPAKPLSKSYSIYKGRKGKGQKRDLFFTGQLLASVKVRSVTGNQVWAAPGSEKRNVLRAAPVGSKPVKGNVTNRDVARGNQKREPWFTLSPLNQRSVMAKVKTMVSRIKERLLLSSVKAA